MTDAEDDLANQLVDCPICEAWFLTAIGLRAHLHVHKGHPEYDAALDAANCHGPDLDSDSDADPDSDSDA